MATESTTSERPERKPAAKTESTESPKVSPEGVPYQSSGFEGTWRDEENPGPFEEGEGRNSPLLKDNVDKAAEREAELAESEKTLKSGRVSETPSK